MKPMLFVLALLLAGCTTAVPPSEIDVAIDDAIAAKRIPGAVLWIERDGRSSVRAYGDRALEPSVEPMTADTVFDVASITKVVATAPSIAKLVEQGKLALDAPVRTYLPEYADDAVTVRHLVTHTSAIRPGLDLRDEWSGYDEGVRRALAERPQNRPGTIFRYSDVNYILLGEIVRRVSGETLDAFARRHVFEPLRMRDTGFRPSQRTRVAPTQDGLRGVVHDPTARRMGGVAGHAGLFSTAADLAKFARWAMTSGLGTDITPPEVAIRRAFGFDLDSSYSRPRGDLFPHGSFGHTGWTGGFLWIDPASRTFYVFLSNRVHPDGKGSVIALQRRIGTLVAQSAGLTQPVPRRFGIVTGGGDAQNGIDVLHASGYEALRGMRIGLVTNHTGIDRTGNPTVDLLRGAPGVTLAAIFTPEHGLRGTEDHERVVDEGYHGIPVISLYNERRKPAVEQLANLDALVFDVQDIGTRFYTYISTMGLAMEAAAEAKVKFVVLDRVNAIGGALVEGPMLEGPTHFTAWHPIPVRHGKTVGELAQQFRDERGIAVDLTVIPVKNWKREQWQDEAGLPWVNTSPNMRSLQAAGLYPGIGLLERALSVGRGTPTPFEILGAPYIDGAALIREVGPLPGVALEPVRFTPTASIHKDQECGGVRITITDRRALRAVDVGIAIASALARLYPQQFPVDDIQPLLRHEPTLEAIRAGKSVEEIRQLWGVVVHGATVIDGTPRVADVVMRGDRIERVDDAHEHEGFRVIDATDQYVIPGLVDMHAHLLLDFDRAFTDQMLRMFLAHGVTTVRDPGSNLDILALRRETRAPRILTAGPILIGSKFIHPQFQPVFSADEVRSHVRAQAEAGVDFIKVYASMPPELVKAAIDEAHAHDLPILGHLQRTTWSEAARLGIDGIEHAAPWTNDLTSVECPQSMQGRVCWMENLDRNKACATARVLAEHEVVVDPTLIAMQTKIFGAGDRDVSMLPPYVVDFWRKNAYDLASGRAAWPNLLAFTRILHEEGVTLVAGTDTPTPWIIPGVSLHEELQFLRDAGIPNAEVLAIATANAARALRRPDLGSIAPGKRADLVILAKNPLDDIAHTRTIVHVIAGGK